jgi:D-alanyl-D-alanine carboxypeptidase/D-alanyl-D-alanine-endopeptidase (penicillin-binding protein 4)
MLGGPYAVARIVQLNAQIAPEEFYIQTSSGLGQNRVTPRAMMKLLRALRNELAKNKMSFSDIMPVAGIDKGTLEGRFDADFARGSVVGKTGTMANTDGGVSSLAGEIKRKTANCCLLFSTIKAAFRVSALSRIRSFQLFKDKWAARLRWATTKFPSTCVSLQRASLIPIREKPTKNKTSKN